MHVMGSETAFLHFQNESSSAIPCKRMICFVPSNPNFIVFVHSFLFIQKNNLYHLVHFASLGCETHDCDCRMLHPGLSDNHGCDSSFQVVSLFFCCLWRFTNMVVAQTHSSRFPRKVYPGSNHTFTKLCQSSKLEPACRNVTLW